MVKAAVLAAIPMALVAAGIYIVVFTPDVVTQTVDYTHSHAPGIFLVVLGLIAGMMAAIFWDVSR